MSEKKAKSSAKDEALKRLKSNSFKDVSAEKIANEIISGNKSALSKGITLLESSSYEHKKLAKKIVNLCLPHSGNSFRLGITGVPGVGKSTFIESFGNIVLEKYEKLAVLAIDPSSQKTKGSILGDKTRMQHLISLENAFIRPSPSNSTLGGVAKATREAIILCEAAGFDFIIVETVGVGQSETEVHSMVDFFMLLMLSGAGDELQGIKKGIMEMADAIIINKADGENLKPAKRAMIEYKSAIHLFPPSDHLFPVNVTTCSGLNSEGLVELIELIEQYKTHVKSNGYFLKNRSNQDLNWFNSHLNAQILEAFYSKNELKEKLEDIKLKITKRELSPFEAADLILKSSIKNLNS